jgi:hypothetical protein
MSDHPVPDVVAANAPSESVPTAQPAPTGAERVVTAIGSALIDGTPVAYIVVLAAVVSALAFVPMSIALSSGAIFPMSQGVYGLVGWVLGPIAGAVASGIGTLMGVFFAPHTAGIWPVSLYGAVVTSFAAGCMRPQRRVHLTAAIALLCGTSLSYYLYRAYVINGIPASIIAWGSLVDWLALLLFISPVRTLIPHLLKQSSRLAVAVGLALGTFVAFGLGHAATCSITYYLFNWPEPIWRLLIPIIPVEFAVRSFIAVIIGSGVLSGLRAIGLVRPTYAAY